MRERLQRKMIDAVINFGGAIAIDCWLDKTKKITFFGVVAHFIEDANEQFILNDRIICARDLHTDMKDGAYLRQKLLEYLKSYNLDTHIDKLVFVSDRGTNVKKALEQFEAISCFAHMVNNLVDTMLIEISDLVVAVKALVKYFKVTGLNAALDTTLKSFVPTRWNTVFYMIESVIINWDHIQSILEEKREAHRINNINLNALKVRENYIQFHSINQ